jgi:hypothetical protein
LWISIAILVEEHVARGRGWRHLAIVDARGITGLGIVDEHETTATDIARARQRNCEGEADRDRCVDSVAAVSKHLRTDLRRDIVLRRYHARPAIYRVTQRAIANDRLIGGLGKCA